MTVILSQVIFTLANNFSASFSDISVTMYVEDDEFKEEDGVGLVCVQISAGQLDGTTATVALTTTSTIDPTHTPASSTSERDLL